MGILQGQNCWYVLTFLIHFSQKFDYLSPRYNKFFSSRLSHYIFLPFGQSNFTILTHDDFKIWVFGLTALTTLFAVLRNRK